MVLRQECFAGSKKTEKEGSQNGLLATENVQNYYFGKFRAKDKPFLNSLSPKIRWLDLTTLSPPIS